MQKINGKHVALTNKIGKTLDEYRRFVMERDKIGYEFIRHLVVSEQEKLKEKGLSEVGTNYISIMNEMHMLMIAAAFIIARDDDASLGAVPPEQPAQDNHGASKLRPAGARENMGVSDSMVRAS